MKDYYLDDLKNAVVLRALEDYIRGEEFLSKKPGASSVTLRDYETAKHFLYSDRLLVFTKLDREFMIRTYRENHSKSKGQRASLWKGKKSR